MVGQKKSYKNNPLLIILIILLVAALIALAIYTIREVITNKRNQFSTNIIECKKTDDEDVEEKPSTDGIISRTYRFFGYSSDADMYTTLKLSTDGKYYFFVNNCEGVTRYTGTYTETNTAIRLADEINLDFNKIDGGNTLTFDLAKAGICHDSGGTFSLDDFVLGKNE